MKNKHMSSQCLSKINWLFYPIILLVILTGCQSSNDIYQNEYNISTKQTPSKCEYTGLWTHTQSPDTYSLVIFEQQNNKISFEITAIKGDGAQIATAQVTNVELINGNGTFEFVDSFDNRGKGEIIISDDTITLTYPANIVYQGNWCIDSGAGNYKKTKELSEIDWTNTDDSKNVKINRELNYNLYGIDNEKELDGKTYLWYGKYYLAGNDLEYYNDVHFSFCADGTAEKTSYGKTTKGEYHIYESDKSEYDFRVLLKFENGEEFMLYGKSNNPKNDINFYLYVNGTIKSYGRYLNETYINTESMVRATKK